MSIPLLKGGPTGLGGGGGGWVGPWPVGGWVSLVLGNLAQRAYSPPGGGGGVWLGGWVGGWVLFLVFPGAKTFLLIKKSDGSLYKVLEQSAAVTTSGPVVKPCAADVQAWIQTQVPAISNFGSVTLSQNFSVCNGHMMQAELTPPPPDWGTPPLLGE